MSSWHDYWEITFLTATDYFSNSWSSCFCHMAWLSADPLGGSSIRFRQFFHQLIPLLCLRMYVGNYSWSSSPDFCLSDRVARSATWSGLRFPSTSARRPGPSQIRGKTTGPIEIFQICQHCCKKTGIVSFQTFIKHYSVFTYVFKILKIWQKLYCIPKRKIVFICCILWLGKWHRVMIG